MYSLLCVRYVLLLLSCFVLIFHFRWAIVIVFFFCSLLLIICTLFSYTLYPVFCLTSLFKGLVFRLTFPFFPFRAVTLFVVSFSVSFMLFLCFLSLFAFKLLFICFYVLSCHVSSQRLLPFLLQYCVFSALSWFSVNRYRSIVLNNSSYFLSPRFLCFF